jgi:putative hemolysin
MFELILILVLLVLNGVFAMAEIAIVSAKKPRLQQRANEGSRGAAMALKLAAMPERFLSTVQIGITLVGVLAGAFGGASLSGYLVPHLQKIPWLATHAEQISFGLVVAFITYLSLIIGELVPKSLALRNAEKIATFMAAPMNALSRVARPLVYVLELSTRGLMRFFGKPETPTGPTRSEVEVLLREGMITGDVHHEEGEMVEGVFDLREMRAEEIMRPKPKVSFLHIDDHATHAADDVKGTRQAVFPVYDESRDHVVGLVSLRDLYLHIASGKNEKVSQLMRDPVFVPDNQPALTLLTELRKTPLFAAVVTDEFGIVRGLVTVEDLVEEVVGDLGSFEETTEVQLRQLGENLWLVDGMMEIDAVAEAIPGLDEVVHAETESFQTLAGLIVHHLERLPKEGESFNIGQFHVDVVDMDRQRIDKVSIRRLQPETPTDLSPLDDDTESAPKPSV